MRESWNILGTSDFALNLELLKPHKLGKIVTKNLNSLFFARTINLEGFYFMRTFIFIIWFYPQSKTCSLFDQFSNIWNSAASAFAEFKHANWSSWFHKNPNAYNHTHFWISRYCWVTKFVCPFLYFWIRNVAGVGRQANGHTRFIDSSLCSAGRVLLFIPKHTEGHQDTRTPKYSYPNTQEDTRNILWLDCKTWIVQEFHRVFKGFRSWQFDFWKPQLISWTEITFVGFLLNEEYLWISC